ncbi:glycosyltransferase family 2 protein [Microbacterium pumilum]|uniref:4,4'-diaponeurosporenoate glycosyltransferase n=1 Tax=Microbacterium pumilum TaxID=344165 RepID=A0ABN2T0D9_9MICO
MTGAPIEAVIVVVPVHDEAALLDRCLTALKIAIDRLSETGMLCIVRVVLDACADGSARIVGAHGLTALAVEENLVGAARALGIAAAWNEVDTLAPDQVWIANTDGDSAVPPSWLTVQIAAAHAGADIFVGTVRPDFADLDPRHQRHWHATHTPGVPNGHVHGASLGVRAGIYFEAGGFEAAPEHEDVSLVDRCRRLGGEVVASDDAEVLTSGRTIGRTPGGYAGYLREQALAIDID